MYLVLMDQVRKGVLQYAGLKPHPKSPSFFGFFWGGGNRGILCNSPTFRETLVIQRAEPPAQFTPAVTVLLSLREGIQVVFFGIKVCHKKKLVHTENSAKDL